jgi:uncharacterized protein GlcG (DUF336 family)
MSGLFHRPRIAAFGGGLPIKLGDGVIGANGVSGGTAAQDIECAQAALAGSNEPFQALGMDQAGDAGDEQRG